MSAGEADAIADAAAVKRWRRRVWSPSTAARMAKRYCHIGNAAQLNAVEMLMVDCESDPSDTGGHKKGHSEEPLTLSEHRKLLKLDGSPHWTISATG